MLNIRVTHHALKRFRERTHMFFPRRYFTSREITESLMIAQVSKARKVWKWKTCPFYLNKVTSRYGDVEVVERSGVYYILKREQKGILILTVVRKWWCE